MRTKKIKNLILNVVTIKEITTVTLISFLMAGCSNPFGKVSELKFQTASLQFDKPSYSYGTYSLGSTAVAEFTISNTGLNSADGCGPVILSDKKNFSIQSSTCSDSSLERNESCMIEVLFNPTSPGIKRLTLSRICKNGIEVSTSKGEITAEALAVPTSNSKNLSGTAPSGGNSSGSAPAGNSSGSSPKVVSGDKAKEGAEASFEPIPASNDKSYGEDKELGERYPTSERRMYETLREAPAAETASKYQAQ